MQMAAMQLVNADRTALYLVDERKEELYAHLFSVGPEEEEHVKRVITAEEPTSMDVYINQLGCSLREVVFYKGRMVR